MVATITDPGSNPGKDLDLDDLLVEIGDSHSVQKRLLWIILIPLNTIMAAVYLYPVFMLSVPNHWCHVPGGESFNVSGDIWKNVTLPREIGPDGRSRSSQCNMYTLPENFDSLLENETILNQSPSANQTSQLISLLYLTEEGKGHDSANQTGCKYGWEYDKKYYRRTIPSTFNWVCDKDIYAPNVFAFGSLGSLCGYLLFGYLGDKVGRRPVSLLCLGLTMIIRFVGLFFAFDYYTFLAFYIFSCSTSGQAYASPFTIAAELSGRKFRAHMYAWAFNFWVVGMVMLSFLAWLAADWLIIGICSLAPTILLFLLECFYLPESPRWLLSQGRLEEAEDCLTKMAAQNQRKVPRDFSLNLQKLSEKREQKISVRDLIKIKHLAIITFMLTICWVAIGTLYRAIHLNLDNMAGNPFINFFLLSLMEIPGNVFGQYGCDKLGRKWTQAIGMTIAAVVCASNAAIITTPALKSVSLCLSLGLKLFIEMCWVAIYLQTVEMYPTFARQTGQALCFTISSAFDAVVPYITHMGTTHLSYPYIIMAFIGIAGSLAAFGLPETLGSPMPENVDDTKTIWRDKRNYTPWLKDKNTVILEGKVQGNGYGSNINGGRAKGAKENGSNS